MDYAELTELLQREPPRCEVTAFPDGSVDTYYEIHGSDDERLDSHTAFGEQIAGDADTFSITQTTTEPGGQAVNIAQQTHALGDKTWLFGHLDHSIFDHLDVEIASMGAPASMFIYKFDDGDLMLADDSADMPEWSLSDLRTAAGDAFAARLTVDVVCCANWASFDAMTDALDQLTAHEFDGNLFVFDPGDLTAAEPASITRLCETLTDLERSYDIVLSADSDEIAQFMTAVGIENDLGEATLTRLRERIDITGVVCHGHPTATAAMADGYVVFPTIEADGKKRQTGAGDRFSAGLAHGLAAGFGWETALGLGNLCASYHVEYGETGTREALTKYVEQA